VLSELMLELLTSLPFDVIKVSSMDTSKVRKKGLRLKKKWNFQSKRKNNIF